MQVKPKKETIKVEGYITQECENCENVAVLIIFEKAGKVWHVCDECLWSKFRVRL